MVLPVLLSLVLVFCTACGSMSESAAVSEAESFPESGQPEVAAPPEASDAAEEEEEYGEEIEAEEEPPPIDHSWELGAPEDHGASPEAIGRFRADLDTVEIRGAVMVKDGVIIDEYYKGEYGEDTVFRMASVTKSVSGAVVGLAVDRGLLDIDAKLTEFFPQLEGPGQEDKHGITVEHLLTHTSGIYWNEWAGGDYFRRFSSSENWVDFVFSQHMQYTPGAAFNYTTGGSHLLGGVIEAATRETAFNFAKEHMFSLMGMDSVRWRSDPQGITDAGNGIEMTLRDAARFGQLYLDGGMWRGQRILSEDWVKRSVSYQAATGSATGQHGYCWWLKPFGGYDAYYAMGHAGQYIIVVPELELVVAMASSIRDTYVPQRMLDAHINEIFG